MFYARYRPKTSASYMRRTGPGDISAACLKASIMLPTSTIPLPPGVGAACQDFSMEVAPAAAQSGGPAAGLLEEQVMPWRMIRQGMICCWCVSFLLVPEPQCELGDHGRE